MSVQKHTFITHLVEIVAEETSDFCLQIIQRQCSDLLWPKYLVLSKSHAPKGASFHCSSENSPFLSPSCFANPGCTSSASASIHTAWFPESCGIFGQRSCTAYWSSGVTLSASTTQIRLVKSRAFIYLFILFLKSLLCACTAPGTFPAAFDACNGLETLYFQLFLFCPWQHTLQTTLSWVLWQRSSTRRRGWIFRGTRLKTWRLYMAKKPTCGRFVCQNHCRTINKAHSLFFICLFLMCWRRKILHLDSYHVIL